MRLNNYSYNYRFPKLTINWGEPISDPHLDELAGAILCYIYTV